MVISMDNKNITEKIKCLEGISWIDWLKIKTIIDKSFDKQIGEFKHKLELSCDDLCDL